MKKVFQNKPLQLFLLLTLICACIFVPYICSDTAFVLGWDMRTLYSSNFESLRNQLQSFVKTGDYPFWTWVSFLGNDFYSSKLFYFQDIFDYPFALTNLSYETIIMIQTYLKFLVAGFGFYAYSRTNHYSEKTSLLGSVIFAFSAYNLQTMMHPFFGSFFVFLPLYFRSIDLYIMKKKKLGFIFWVFFLFVNNYYLFYSVSLFTIIYYIWKYQRYHSSFKGLWPSAFRLIGFYIVGLLLSGVVVVPEILNILGNSRVGERSSSFVYDSILPYLEYLVGLFTPTSVLANRNTAITSLYSYTSANDSVMAVFLWNASVGTLLFPQLFTKKNHRKEAVIMTVVISTIALIPILSSAMHGFSEPSFRWLGSVSFLILAAVMPILDDPQRMDLPLLKRSIIIFTILLIVSTPLLAYITGTSFKDIFSDYTIVLLFVPFLILSGWALYKNRRTVLLLSTVIELCIASFFSFYGCPAFSNETDQQLERSNRLMGAKDEYNEYLLKQDPSNATCFYRSYIDPQSIYWDLSTNFNLNFNIRGMISYDSTYHSSANDLKKLSDVEDYLTWTFDIRDPNIMNLVSAKYAVVTSEDQVPFTNYRYFGEYYSMLVYENLDYINLGKTYNKVISYDEYGNDTSIVTNTVICNAEDLSEIESLLGTEEFEFSTAVSKDNYVYGDITTEEKGFAVISVPYDTGWTLSVNGKTVKTYEVNGGMTGFAVEAGYNEIQMNFVPKGLKAGMIVTASGIVILLVLVAFQFRKNGNL